jgi:hypothetical protein
MGALHAFEDPTMMRFPATAAILAFCLGGCAGPRAPATPGAGPAAATSAPSSAASMASAGARYRCDQGFSFTVRFTEDSAVLDAGARGSEVLLRDAGGATPQQTVYSNTRMRAEFGLGATGREAMLRYASPPLAAHCIQES